MNATPAGNPVKFLVVDDVEENLVALGALLQRDGLEIHAARSGTDALELLLIHDFALALVDVQMPVMDGFELAELMRGAERSKHVPIIFLTAGPTDHGRVFKGYESGAVDFLFKPLDPNILRHKANTFLDLYLQRQQLALEVERRELVLNELRETLRLNEMFTAVLGHDLRNPLGAMMAAAHVLEIRFPDDPTPKRLVASGARMAQMIDGLLDLARARLGGGIVVTPAETDLGPLAETIVGEHQVLDPKRSIKLATSGDLRGTWDEGRLKQVLSNLLGNALKHGTKETDVLVSIDGRDGAEVAIEVNNHGVIRADVRASLFDPFRAGTTGKRTQGLGLGLYIVDQIAKAHGGSVSMHSSEESGTTFRVRLPRAR